VGWLEGHVTLPVQYTCCDQGLGRPDACGDGLGEFPRPGLQVDPVGPRSDGGQRVGERCVFGLGQWLGRCAVPGEWSGPGAGWLVGRSVAGTRRTRDVAVDGSEPLRCGAGAATAMWATC